MNTKHDIRLITLANYVKPKNTEIKKNGYILNGRNNSFYQYIIDRYNGSITNSAVINSYVDLIYGGGLVNNNNNAEDFLQFRAMLSNESLKRIIFDYQLFGEAMVQIIPSLDRKTAEIHHISKEKTAPEEEDENGEINAYWYCRDFEKEAKYGVVRMPILNNNMDDIMCYPIKPYKAGGNYFSDPDYIAGLQYAMLEEEMSNYYVNHIQNGLSFGYIVNVPYGSTLDDEQKDKIYNEIKSKLAGSSNAGKFMINFNYNETPVTIEQVNINDAHSQWQFLTSEARQQILTSHRVTSPMLFGVKDNTGLGNNANELDEAEAQLLKRIIKPKQMFILRELEKISAWFGFNLDLAFIPFRGSEKNEDTEKEKVALTSNFHPVVNLIMLGEDAPQGYELIGEHAVDYDNDELETSKLLSLAGAKTGTARPNARSAQDNADIIIRYKYSGNKNPEREFCKRMMAAGKIYRKEDIIMMGNMVVNPGFGMSPNEDEPYSIWLWKGGGKLSEKYQYGTCKHFWTRVIYLRSGANAKLKDSVLKQISTSEARRKGYKVPTNDTRVSIAPHDMDI